MINLSSNRLVGLIRLQTPDVGINLGDLVDCSAVYNSLPSAGKVWKKIGKLVAIEPMGEKLYAKMCIWTLI